MILFSVPGLGQFEIEHVIMDYNGTLAKDGKMYVEVGNLLHQLANLVSLYVITADTFGLAAQELKGYPVKLVILEKENQQEQKLNFIKTLGVEHCIAIGNGVNDALMLKEARLGFAILQEEGIALEAMLAADIVFPCITEALHALLEPRRLIATLRK